MASRETTQISGTVDSVNEKGIKLNGTWYNFSKHHTVPAVQKGQSVVLTIEGGKWINGLTLNGASAPAPAPPAPPTHSHTPAPMSRPKSELFSPDSDEPDSRTQTRLAAVQASATFHATRECSFDDVLNFAGQIEEWVGRA